MGDGDVEHSGTDGVQQGEAGRESGPPQRRNPSKNAIHSSPETVWCLESIHSKRRPISISGHCADRATHPFSRSAMPFAAPTSRGFSVITACSSSCAALASPLSAR